jgi:hypothetical protein
MFGLLLIYVPPAEVFFWDVIPVGIYFSLGVIVYFILFYKFGLYPYEKDEIRNILSKIKARMTNLRGKTA